MKRVLLMVVLASLAMAVGCQKKQKTSLDPVPAPAAYDEPLYNDSTMAPPPAPVVVEPAPTPAPSGSTYTVAKGDTLYSIAKRVYGQGNRWPDIASANNISDPTKLRVGQVLTIP